MLNIRIKLKQIKIENLKVENPKDSPKGIRTFS